jgi:transcriptional regulator with XRE-family HTH domain
MVITKPQEAMFVKMTVGERLRWLMEYREIKQTELAPRIGITQSGISNLVTDSARKPSAPTLLALAEELRCSPNWLLDGKGDPFAWAPLTSPEQVELITAFRSLDTGGRKALLDVAKSMKKRDA